MPSMANLTVKASNGTTDVVYNVLSKATGYGQWATWRQDANSTLPYAARPLFRVRVNQTPNKVSHVDCEYSYPFRWTNSTTGLTEISEQAVRFSKGAWHVPQGIDVSFITEASAQFLNLMNHADIRACFLTQSTFS